MHQITSSSPSLFATKSGSSSSASHRQKMEQDVQKFEGMLWDEVAKTMSSVKMGPSMGGYGGKVYRQMMWHKVASKDFGGTDQALTKTTMHQLVGSSKQSSTVNSGAGHTSGASQSVSRIAGSSFGQHVSASGSSSTNAQSWVHLVWHDIKSGAEKLDVPVKGLLAQAALETGWGHNATGHNLFGVKAHGKGNSFTAPTHEFKQGVMRQVRSRFQSYPSAQHAIQDFVSIIEQSHPNVVGKKTVSGYAHALQSSGYATDPRYAQKIEAVANSPRMQKMISEVKNSGLGAE